jgi:hypothetical protein
MDNRSSLGLSKSPLADGYGGTLSSLSAELPVNRMNSSYTVSDSGSVSKLTALPEGTLVTLYFLAAPTFVNSASLVCPGGVNMVFAAGDSAILRSLGDNVWRLLGKLPASQACTITDATASSLVVGPNGATNPTLQVDGSTASAATGFLIKSAAAAAGLALSVLSSGANENLTIDAKGTGTVTIGSVSTGLVKIGATNQLTVSSAGAVAVGGTLAVTGASTLTGNTIVGASGGTGIRLNASGGSQGVAEFCSSDANPYWAAGRDGIISGNPGIGFAYGSPPGTIAATGVAFGIDGSSNAIITTSNGTSQTTRLSISQAGGVSIPGTTASTLPTNGALVLSGTGAGLGVNGQVSANNFLSAAAGTTPHFSSVGSSNFMTTLGGSVAITTASGGTYFLLYVVEDTITGNQALWLLANGQANLVTASGTLTWVASTNSPPSGNFSVAYDAGTATYRIYNNKNASCDFATLLMRVA